MEDAEVCHALALDEAYHVERVLASGRGLRTELVSLDGAGPFVRKRLPAELANPSVWARLMGLECPFLPRVQMMYRLPDQLVVVLEHVEGESLQTLVEREGPLSYERMLGVMSCVCEAAASLHGAGVVHRDITPRNVIVSARDAHLIDLGIARLHASDAERDTTLLGTWGFAAPEQFGFAQTDERSDIYSLGSLLGYGLSGAWPDDPGFDAFAPCGKAEKRAWMLVGQARSLEPSARPKDARELLGLLESCECDDVLEGGAEDSPHHLGEASAGSYHFVQVWRDLPSFPGELLRSVGGPRLALCVILAIAALLVMVVLFVSGVDATMRQATPRESFLYATITLGICVWGVFLPVYEALSAISHLGEYRVLRRASALLRWSLRVAGHWAVGLLGAMLVCMASAMLP